MKIRLEIVKMSSTNMTSRRNIQIGLICVVFSIVVLENANAARRANLPDLGEDVQKYIYKILVDDSLHARAGRQRLLEFK